jgi:hypothetical protein
METCKLCKDNKLKTGAEHSTGICGECSKVIGAHPMPPPRRPAVGCARCGGRRFIRAIDRFRDPFQRGVVARAITYDLSVEVLRIGVMVNREPKLDLTAPRGLIARYVCAGCGFIEEHCEDPAAILIGPEHMTDVVDYGDDGPYR